MASILCGSKTDKLYNSVGLRVSAALGFDGIAVLFIPVSAPVLFLGYLVIFVEQKWGFSLRLGMCLGFLYLRLVFGFY